MSAPSESSEAKRRYLEERLRGRVRNSGTAPSLSLPARLDAGAGPASFGQQRLWFLDQLSPGGKAWNEHFLLEIDGDLEERALERAVASIVSRHEALRTCFRQESAELRQVVSPEFEIRMERVGCAPGGVKATAEAIARATTFSLDQPPLFRFTLICAGPASYGLLFSNHHIICDALSRQILLSELADAYGHIAQGLAVPTVRPELDYRAFSEWQLREVGQPRVRAQARKWAERLAGSRSLEMPRDRTAAPPGAGGRWSFSVGAELWGRLEKLAIGASATPFMANLAVFAALLSRWTGECDLVVGAPEAGRSHPAAQAMVGFFVNTLPIRIQLDPQQSFAALLAGVRERVLEALSLAEVPFEQIVQATAPKRDFSQSPLFQVMFSQQPRTPARALAGGLALRGSSLPPAAARLPLTLDIIPDGGGATGAFEYDASLFSERTVRRLADRFVRLAEQAVADPNAPLACLEIRTSDESKLLFQDWSPPLSDEAQGTVVSAFWDQAGRTPAAVALRTGWEELTFAELAARAGAVASLLAENHVRRGDHVGLCFSPGAELVIGMLGILSAGAAYVPLDPAHPRARLDLVLDDADVAVVLTSGDLAAHLLRGRAALLVMDYADRGSPSGVVVAPDPADAAYVIYTSGSTGTPKGVVVEHRNVVSFFSAMDALLGDEGHSVTWVALTSVAFDISVLEILWTLTRGVTVVLPADRERAFGDDTSIRQSAKAIDFSLFFFGAEALEQGSEQYRLLLEAAAYADQNGFKALWTPERHFHAFGGLYPNPAITAAAVAAITSRLQVRAGSVVLPLQDPIRVAEEWAVVDQISGGRTGVAFASGWHVNDFVLQPDAYSRRFELMLERIEQVRALWTGRPIRRVSGSGEEIEVRTLPRPLQPDIPLWLTSSHNVRTFEAAGRLGANVLTHLLGQSFDELEGKIAAYRAARRGAGRDGDGVVTLMLHAFIGENEEHADKVARGPMTTYLANSLDLVRGLAESLGHQGDIGGLNASDREAILQLAYRRYVKGASLIGSPAQAAAVVDRARAIGVDELAALIDFGPSREEVMEALARLKTVSRTVHAPTRLPQNDPLAIASNEGFGALQATPSVLRAIADTPKGRAVLRRLSLLLVGGETLSPELASWLRQLGPRVINMYGPTEATVWSSACELTQDGPVPIGRPLRNTRIYVLGEDGHPAPLGVPGEIWIGGAGVARGYHKRPDLTQAAFKPDPFSSPGSRMYRTGDRGRWNEDGQLEFLGRFADEQIKLRGHRIELGEIEHAIEQHEAVRACAVRLWKTGAEDARLVAYVVGWFGETPSSAQLRRHLAERLPAYMIPNQFVPQSELPLTPNGKLDRKALAPPVKDTPRAIGSRQPATAMERAVAELWSWALGRQDIGLDDEFFELGGHSLTALQLISRCRERFGSALPAVSFFERPTVAGMVELLEQEGCSPPVETTRKSAQMGGALHA